MQEEEEEEVVVVMVVVVTRLHLRVSSCMRPYAHVWARVGSALPPFVLTGPHSLYSFALILTGPRSPSAHSRSCGLI